MKESILIVDDDDRIRELVREMLELFGYTVSEAIDGVDALEKVEQIQPDAMILDVMMPRMDGITLCKTLRAQPSTSKLPIIMLSGKTHLNAAEEGKAAGANQYLFKPVALDVLINNLQTTLNN